MIDHLLCVGAGGTGSILAPLAARYLAYRSADPAAFAVHILDGDSFDATNANRQPCNANPGTHLPKALALASLLCSQGLTRTDSTVDFLSARNASTYIRGSAVSILAVDNHASRRLSLLAFEQLLDETPRNTDALWISPGNSTGLDVDAIHGTVLWWGRVNGQFVGMNPIHAVPNIAKPDAPPPVLGSCANHAHSEPQLLVANSMAASWTLAVLALVLEEKLPPAMSSLDWDLTSHTFS